MSLNKAIESGKEHRQPYKGGKSVSYGCRNHGSCSYCRSNRLHSQRKREAAAAIDSIQVGPSLAGPDQD